MPGYQTERFVNLSKSDKAELTCIICQDILCNPLVAQCCQHSFCENCINDWLKTNNTCPYDRKQITPNELSRPPRIMLNMLGKLEIYCDFNGCKEVVLLENLSQHQVMCEYNVGKCKICLCEIQDKSSHDCIKTLLELNRKANEENEILKRNASAKLVSPTVPQASGHSAQNNVIEESLLRENRELKAEKENYIKTIQELSNKNSQKNSPKLSSFLDLFNHAKNLVWNPIILTNDMNAHLRDKVLSIARDEIKKEYENGSQVCKNIVEKLNTEFGSLWHCTVNLQRPVMSWFIYENGYSMSFKIGEVYFKLYKTKHFNVQEFINRFKSGKTKREIQIFTSVMKQSMTSDVMKITIAAIGISNSLVGIASEIKKQMGAKYSGNWQCFIYANYGTFSIRYKTEEYINFAVDKLNVTLFQASAN